MPEVKAYAFAVRHPILMLMGGLLTVSAVPTYWPLLVAAALLGLAGYLTVVLIRLLLRQRAFQEWRTRALVQRADYEHHLWMAGDPQGMYGAYPPANA